MRHATAETAECVLQCGFGGLLGCLHHRQVHFTKREKCNVLPSTEETLGQGEGKSACQ